MMYSRNCLTSFLYLLCTDNRCRCVLVFCINVHSFLPKPVVTSLLLRTMGKSTKQSTNIKTQHISISMCLAIHRVSFLSNKNNQHTHNKGISIENKQQYEGKWYQANTQKEFKCAPCVGSTTYTRWQSISSLQDFYLYLTVRKNWY